MLPSRFNLWPQEMPPSFQIHPIQHLPTFCFSEEKLQQIIASTKSKSTPGPNHIPYNFYKKQQEAIPLLLDFYNSLLAGTPPYPGFNKAILRPITKQTPMCPAHLIRPITISNTDNRILGAYIADYLQTYVAPSIHRSQIGFLRKKNIKQHPATLVSLMQHLHNITKFFGRNFCLFV